MSARKIEREEHDDSGASFGMNFDWREYYHALRERLWIIILFALIGTTLAFYQAGRTAPVYASKATLMVEPQQDKVLKVEAVRSEDLADQRAISTMLETMLSRTMIERLVSRLKLERDFVFMAKPEGREANSKEDAMSQARSSLSVARRGDTRLIDITAEHADPETARKLADELAAEFLRFRFEVRNSANQMANQFLIEEATRLREKLTRSEIALQDYRQKENAISLEPSLDVVNPRFVELNSQLNAAKTKRAQLEGDLGAADKYQTNVEELMKLPSVSGHPAVVELLGAISSKEAELEILSRRYKAKHPKYIALKQQIDAQKSRIRDVVVTAANSIAREVASAREEEQRLTTDVQEQEKKTYGLGKLQVEYNALKREIETDRTVYESVLSRLKETDLAKGLDQTPIKIVEGAVASYTPVRPDRQKMLTQGSMAGFALGLVLALGLHMMDSSLKTVDDVERTLLLPVLSAVTIRKSSAKRNAKPDLDMVHHQYGPVAESFRTLRSSLALLGRPDERRTFLFTSAVPAEGKTFCASNYAVSLAQQGFKTLLVDCDLRKPALGDVFLDEPQKLGVTDIILGRSGIDEAVISTPVSNLFLLPGGHRAPNPSELLSSNACANLLKELFERFDRVVVDTAPVIAVSETLMIAPLVSTVCLVIRAHSTPRRAVIRACEALTKTGRKPSGVVLNRLPSSSGGYYYYYYSGHYGKKGTYGAPK